MPGFVIVELFLPKLAFYKKIPLYLILSVIISTFFSYFISLLFGFTRETLLSCFLFFLILFGYIIINKKTNILVGLKKNWQVVLVGLIVYIFFFIALLPAIFSLYNGYFVMGGPNWQDTPMHLSIIQSLSQGNFPPQAPYFSGQPLTYYYFSDLHAAIIVTFFGNFFPKVLTFINPFLAMTFFFSVFALSFSITKKKIFSVISAVMAVFFGNLGFFNLINDLFVTGASYTRLIANNSYNFDQKYLQMTPMADYFLQNRPMMVGLPSFILVILLLLKTKKEENNYFVKIFIAGVITASLVKFQLFGFVLAWVFFGIYFVVKLIYKNIKFGDLLKYLFIFGLPSIVFVFLFATTKVENRTLINIFLDSFSWGPWQKNEPVWFIYFLLENLGLGFVIYILGIFFKRSWRLPEIISIYLTSFVIITIPLVMKFTIYEYDMLKFFYYLVPLMSVLLAVLYSKSKHYKLSIFIFIFITTISSLTSINMLVHSFLNKNEGYKYSEYQVGLWIEKNTSQKSVFVTMPTVHSAPSDIGGRLRVISYINWPYSHGFNVTNDNVFSRVEDVTRVYKTGDIISIKLKYRANYVFYGIEEASQFPYAGKLFDQNKNLKLIYNQNGIKIYAIY